MNTARVDVDDIRRRYPIEDVITAHGIELRRVGRSLMGCCPFHDDHTPSLSVGGAPDRFHCFGCGASGDVITFISRFHHVDFLDAVHLLHRSPDPTGPPPPRPFAPVRAAASAPPIDPERAQDINALAWDHLTRPVAHETARAWLRQRRGIDVSALEHHHGQPVAGYAATGWTGLTRHLREHGVTDEELLGLDLSRTSNRGDLVDTLRGRLILPLRDTQDRISGFIGRDVTGHPRAPKYRNPTRTVLYDKTNSLYTTGPVNPGATAVVVEGPLDALAIDTVAAGAGVAVAALATCGAHPTPGQVTLLLSQQPARIVIALDGDAAGHHGTLRWVDLVCRHAHHPLEVTTLPDGTDPADQVTRHGSPGLERILAGRPPVDELAHLAQADGQDPCQAIVEAVRDLWPHLPPERRQAWTTTTLAVMSRHGWTPATPARAASHRPAPPAPKRPASGARPAPPEPSTSPLAI